MSDKTYILGAGSALIDLLVNVDDAFLESINAEKGGTVITEIDEINRIITASGVEPQTVPGGSAGNTIFGLAELGMPTSFIGKIGRDREGAVFRDSLLALGARDAFRYADGVNTGCCLSLITPDSERTMRSNFGASSLLSGEDLTADDFAGARHFHVEGYQLFMPGLVERLVELGEAAECTMSIDLCAFEIIRSMRKRLAGLLPRFDMIFVNEDEAAELCGPGTPQEWAKRLNEIVPIACLKLGVEGSIIRTRSGRSDRVKAQVVPAVDTTGAGDLWASGFLYGYLNGYSMAESARFGSIVSAEVVKVVGPKIPAERWPVIKQQMGIQGV
jgi:sugar/nucleoside kinase (ribokinase family)